MKPVGLLIGFVGYTLMFFGYESIRGPGVGLLDLIVPGRPFNPYTSTGATSSTGSTGSSAAAATPPSTKGLNLNPKPKQGAPSAYEPGVTR
jgi:hypothetical protein